MGEISKEFRIFLLIQAILVLFFAFLYLAITDANLDLFEWTYDDSYFPRAFGVTLLVLGFFTLIAVYRKEWDYIRIMVETTIIWMIMVLIMNILELLIIALPLGALLSTILNSVILIIFLGGNVYFYQKER